MKTLSLCMIVRDEEKTLPACLKNAKEYADEIIIVDTGSVDKTKEIARSFTDQVFDFVWVDDFSKARNFSFDKATSEYCMWLDGDDIVPEETIKNIQKWKESDDDSDVLMCDYVLTYEKNLNPIFHYMRERIVKNQPRFRFCDRVHEVITPQGKISQWEKIAIYHNKIKAHTDRNLKIYLKMRKSGEKFSHRAQFYFARELFYNSRFFQCAKEIEKFLQMNDAFKENQIDACLLLSTCYEKLNKHKKVLPALFRAFEFDTPRGNVLYAIANYFFSLGDYQKAIYWYELDLMTPINLQSGAFVNNDECRFFPCMQLVLCHYRLGDNLNARHYHEIAKGLKPDNEAVKFNDKFFSTI